MDVSDNIAFDDHEKVVFCKDDATGLNAIIAIHSTALGPAAGGCRQWQYASDGDALYDVLRLSQGMSYKNAMAGLRFGGGKAVIVKGDDFDPTEALYERFGEFVDTLDGSYITAEDVGMTPEIMQMIAKKTRYVTGLPAAQGRAGGDPSPKTAYGIFCGIESAVSFKMGANSVAGLKVAVQGVGHVGLNLCRLLHEAGASLVVADMDVSRAQGAHEEFGAEILGVDEILAADVDVLSPCALGAVFNTESIAHLRALIVAGGANNQLETSADGQRLADAGILYAPDYVINGGGIINVACEYYADVDDEGVMAMVAEIGPRLTGIFEESKRTGRPTHVIADEQAKRIIAAANTD